MFLFIKDIPKYSYKGVSLYADKNIGLAIFILYLVIFIFESVYVFSGVQLVFYVTSVIYSLTIIYLNDPLFRKSCFDRFSGYTTGARSAALYSYVITFSTVGFAFYSGKELVLYMSSFLFALAIMYLRDISRLHKFVSRKIAQPQKINSSDLSLLIIKMNETLPSIVGNCELLLHRNYNETEKQFMIRNIYDNSLKLCQLAVITGRLVSSKDQDVTVCSNLKSSMLGKHFFAKSG